MLFSNMLDSIFSTKQALWLTKEIWLRCRFRNLINVQPMHGPCSMVYYKVFGNDSVTIKQEAVAAITTKYNVLFYKDADFESICDSYANCMAKDLEITILDHLPKIDLEVISDMSLTDQTISHLSCTYHYLIAPYEFTSALKESSINLFEIPTILDPEILKPCGYGGHYTKVGNLNAPIFAPYILFTTTPMGLYGTSSALLRAGWFDG